jgi:DNA-binding beta-propeller fold protein YncE
MKLAPLELLAVVALSTVAPLAGGAGASLELVATIPMPSVRGRIDHFSVDVKNHRLYVAALGNDSVEVLDTAQNRHERSLPGFGEPQGLLYLSETRRLYVANGSADRLDILDAGSLASVRRIDKLEDADNVRYDAAARVVVVGYGKGALRLLDALTGDSKADIPLSGHPESFQLEETGPRIFVNVPTAHHIAVVDRAKGALIGTWEVSARANFPMALDEKSRRLFVGTRSPAALLVHDIDSGKEVAKLEIGGDTDDVFFDRERRRVYAICGHGEIDVFRQETADRYVKEATVRTAPRARTGLFVPEESKLYVAAPVDGATPARVLVYAVR